MKIRAFPSPSGSAYWRLSDPFKYMRKQGIDARVVNNKITEEIAQEGDIFVLQNIVDTEGIGLLYAYQQEQGKKIVVEVDDWIELNEDNPNKKHHEVANAQEVFKKTLQIADLVTTTNYYLRDKIKEYNQNVVVLPNYMDMERWQLPLMKNTSNRIRIGWAGSLTHLEDVKMVVPALKRILKEFPHVELILVGDYRFKELFEGLPRVEVMVGTPFETWPARLHGLRLDIAIAPLKDTEFNRCKSNIKFQEMSIAGYPGVYSDVVYEEQVPTLNKLALVATNDDEWYSCLRNYVVSPALRREHSAKARNWVLTYCDLEKRIDKWVDAYRSLTV